jgi:hypothetical protein
LKQEQFASEVATELIKQPRGAQRRAALRVYKNDQAALLAKHNEAVKEAITEHVQETLKAASITRERLAMELFRVATFDPGKMFREDGTMIPIPELDEDTRRCIQGFDVERRVEKHEDAEDEVYYVMKPRMYNKNQAAEILTRFTQLPGDIPGAGPATAVPIIHVHFARLEDGKL